MLKKVRTSLAILFWLGITILFLDITGSLHLWLGWMAKVQFLPAVMALNVGIIAALVLLTLVFGRVYCSVICPLGVFQDAVSHVYVVRKRRKKDRKPFHYTKEVKWLRYGVWVLFVVAIIAGIHAFVAILAPYSAYGRIVQNLFAPVYGWINNLFAALAERAGSYAFYGKEVWLRSLPTFIVAVVTLIAIVILAWKGGRTYCNTICPVGTTLSFFSRFALFRPVINTEKCRNCKMCEHNCKASCINIAEHKIDYSRCVDCFNCIDTCKFGALQYKFAYGKRHPEQSEGTADSSASPQNDGSRRAFITGTALAVGAATLKAQEKKVDGGLAEIMDKKVPERKTRITPPGSISDKNMYSHCTACQLCVAECPSHVLRPSGSLEHFMQPESSYERGYCRPECTRCSEVCPAGAIRKVDRNEKSSIQIGHAVWVKENCLPWTEGVSCGNCARHCPVGAILMVPSDPDAPDSVKIPAVDESRCIGCGACENLCPARPLSAIYVEGHSVHKTV